MTIIGKNDGKKFSLLVRICSSVVAFFMPTKKVENWSKSMGLMGSSPNFKIKKLDIEKCFRPETQ